ncbi:helix-turn-helix domain-containing protein [Photobacterium indicum]|uniref:helix-turn-helix domain-containing protein n=1 Tax=Photobacterium indicum TaxID=81447 RepID=UPI003D0FA0C9
MNEKDILRLNAIRDVCEKRIQRSDAAGILRLSRRQVYRLVKRFMEFGFSGLLSLKRGRPSNHRHDL